jgi:hypothetical protein
VVGRVAAPTRSANTTCVHAPSHRFKSRRPRAQKRVAGCLPLDSEPTAWHGPAGGGLRSGPRAVGTHSPPPEDDLSAGGDTQGGRCSLTEGLSMLRTLLHLCLHGSSHTGGDRDDVAVDLAPEPAISARAKGYMLMDTVEGC